MRRLLTCLALCLATLPSWAEDSGMTPDERAALREEIRAYLLENPEVLVEAMGILQAREEAAAVERDAQLVQSHSPQLFENGLDFIDGNLNGDVTIVEFMDYRCGYCRKAHPEVQELLQTDGNIRLIVKEFPILGEESLLSSQFAIAVKLSHGDVAYKAAHEALIALRGNATSETLAALAKSLGHDPQAIMAKMSSDEVRAIIEENHALADKLEISGTPTFIFGDTMIRGYMPLDGMRELVAELRG
jgi:protein-disulfide isomerase